MTDTFSESKPDAIRHRSGVGQVREILPGFGSILPAAEAERFAAAVPSSRVAEIDANHYTITTHDDSIAAIGAFLRTS